MAMLMTDMPVLDMRMVGHGGSGVIDATGMTCMKTVIAVMQLV